MQRCSTRVLGQMRAFFAQPRDAKHAVSRSERNPWGYYDKELTKNTRDWKEIFDFAASSCGRSVPRWPSGLPGFKDTLIDYYRGCEAVAMRLVAHRLRESRFAAARARWRVRARPFELGAAELLPGLFAAPRIPPTRRRRRTDTSA